MCNKIGYEKFSSSAYRRCFFAVRLPALTPGNNFSVFDNNPLLVGIRILRTIKATRYQMQLFVCVALVILPNAFSFQT